MADQRKVFPVEKILELVTGKPGADVKEIAGYILGSTVDCDECAKAVAPFASAWLARWYPRFMEMDWEKDESWESFVKQAASVLGDNVSITPMTGRLKDITDQTLGLIRDTKDSLAKQTAAVVELEKRVRELEPLEARAAAAQKKSDELEDKLKTMKKDMGALQRQAAAYQGKVAIDHDELMENIKDAIKDGLKGLSVGAAAAAATTEATGETTSSQDSVPDDFGFGSSGPDADGFGF